MEKSSARHKNYEILNLIGYGLSKFGNDFIKEFGFTTKTAFYEYCVEKSIAETVGTIKNRMDIFDPFFENDRKGWWQKGDVYIHRKVLIDGLFGNEEVKGYADIVKLYLQENFNVRDLIVEVKPIIKSRFKKLQKTGLEAELYFIHNFEEEISLFKNGTLEDARLYGDGYDFQVSVNDKAYLAEVKGIREKTGEFRLTKKEYERASEYKDDYILSLVVDLNDNPTLKFFENPIKQFKFKEINLKSKEVITYHSVFDIC